MKNLDEIKMLATTLLVHEVITAKPDEDPPTDPDTGTGSGADD